MPSVETTAKNDVFSKPHSQEGPLVLQAPHWPPVSVLPDRQAPIKVIDAPKIMRIGGLPSVETIAKMGSPSASFAGSSLADCSGTTWGGSTH